MKPALLNCRSEAQLLAWHDHDHRISLAKCGILTDAALHQSKHVGFSSPYVLQPHFLYNSHSSSTGCFTSFGLSCWPSTSSSSLNYVLYRYGCFLFSPCCGLGMVGCAASYAVPAAADGSCDDYTSVCSPRRGTLSLPLFRPLLPR